ncbi:beta tubulin [Xaviernesmea oryzae]|uniref:Beta tubulin n=1 Tax=Xaviernesmea oryzae TaxID=464029 RepID=A0A1Q9B1H9_9HYPH|nr:DUF2163 domain-containing protein [Xaviernesmea oryzae]OLP61858.1 beta tubulin [Xaviernesmea oryzae]SEL75232.1 phage conserved hypothetical protein BR0599 [Xaviernesmea oryzae]
MRQLPSALAAHLGGDATTLCHAWRVTRRDGVVLGFTDHDEDLAFGGLSYRAASGFASADALFAAGLSVEAGEVHGGLSSEAITEADVAAGRYDGARVEVFSVNWAAPETALLLQVHEIGEVSRAGGAFRAELRRITHRLEQVQGRLYSRRCDADFGDARCGLDVTAPPLTVERVIAAVAAEASVILSTPLPGADNDWRLGRLHVLSGAATGWTGQIGDQTAQSDGRTRLSLWLPPPVPLRAGDRVAITAGCDKRFSTCRQRFGNGVNFQGVPHMPGLDFAYGYADGDSEHDGRPLFEDLP